MTQRESREFLLELLVEVSEDLGMLKLLLPVLCDCGVAPYDDDSVYLLDLETQSSTIVEWDHEPEQIVRDQIESASRSQLQFYTAWAESVMNEL